MSGLWYREVLRDESSFGLKVTRTLHREQSEFQLIEILDTPFAGKVLSLDGVLMTSVADEFYYHEMIVHPALTSAPDIRRVLIIGGGDGGTAREVLRHPGVERCVMVEIDEKVVAACKEHLLEIGSAWDDPRLELRFEDGVRYVAEAAPDSFDVVILDGSDPIGPAEGLFGRDFYEGVRELLVVGGVFALQSESPTVYEDVFFDIQDTLRDVFGHADPYFGSVLLYGSGMWTWTLASTEPRRPPRPERVAAVADLCRYYTGEIHEAAFAQPAFVRRRLQGR